MRNHPAQYAVIESAVKRILSVLDGERPGTAETPLRVARAWLDEWTWGYDQDPSAVLKTFTDGAEGANEMVLMTDIPVYSHCEHHMAPFFGVAHIAYIPNQRIVGLSKLARLTNIFARRLQVQERLTNEIADALQNGLEPLGVGVQIQCRHMCMESRGIRATGTSTTTCALRGAILDKPEARAEFLSMIQNRRDVR